MAESIEDAADHLISPALTAKHFELSHHAVQRVFDTRHGVAGITIALTVQAMVTALEFLAVEIREQRHTVQ